MSPACGRQDGRLSHCMAPQPSPGGGTGASLLGFMGEGRGVWDSDTLLSPTEAQCVCVCARARAHVSFHRCLAGIWWVLPKSFSVVRPCFSGLLATGERFLLDIIFPVPFGHFGLVTSTAPCLGYMGGNKETQEEPLLHCSSRPETP